MRFLMADAVHKVLKMICLEITKKSADILRIRKSANAIMAFFYLDFNETWSERSCR